MSKRNRSRHLRLTAVTLLFILVSSGAARSITAQSAVVLVPGWNNVLYTGPSGPIPQVLGSLSGNLQSLLFWNAGEQRWEISFASSPQTADLFGLQSGTVYWVDVDQPAFLPQGITPVQPAQFVRGWNNVAYLGAGAPGSALLERHPVWSWDALSQRWLYFDPAAPQLSDFQLLAPGRAYWLLITDADVAAQLQLLKPEPISPTPSPSPTPRPCFPFVSRQPSLAEANEALTQTGLGVLPTDAAPPTLRTGVDGQGPPQAPYVPPTLMRAVAWVESNWQQGTRATGRGQVGQTLTSSSCAYGLMQILAGMRIGESPTPTQTLVGTDYRANIAAGFQILTANWNRDPGVLPYLGRHDPHILEDWYFVIWSYHCFGPVCLDYGAHNNPDDPALPWPRPAYNSPAQLERATSLGYADYPYQELVYGLVAHPPIIDRAPLWSPIPVELPPHNSVGYPDPSSAGEASAHLDDGTSHATLTLPSQSPLPLPSPSGSPLPILVPPPAPATHP